MLTIIMPIVELFFEGVTVNPNITKQKGKAFMGSDDHVQILSMPSNAGVKPLSFVSTPCIIYSHQNYHVFFPENIQGLEPSTFS